MATPTPGGPSPSRNAGRLATFGGYRLAAVGGVLLMPGTIVAIVVTAALLGRPLPTPSAPALFAAPIAPCAPIQFERPRPPVHVPPPPPPGSAPPRRTTNVAPVYPEEARVARLEGVVILEVVLDCAGKVVDARVLRSVPGLDQAAVDTVRQWAYAPALKGGKPTSAVITVAVPFHLPTI